MTRKKTKTKRSREALALDDREELRRRVAWLERQQPSRQETAIRVLRRRHFGQVLQIFFRGEHAIAWVDGRPLPLADQIALNEDAARAGVAGFSRMLQEELQKMKRAWAR